MRTLTPLLGFAVLLLAAPALADDATVAGDVTTPYPTLLNASIEWAITGDDNANGVVTVRYKKASDADFRDGLPLFRIPGGTNQGGAWANKHAGSLFGLEPGTTYDVELTLTDPDGGDATATTSVTTRPDPVAAPGAPTVDVDPGSIDEALAASTPGQILVLADGTYGEIVVPNDGADGHPIVLRAAGTGAVIEGDVRLDGRAFVYAEGLTVHGKFKLNDASDIVVRGCTIDTPDFGIVAYNSGVTNGYFVDNTITGPTAFDEDSLGVSGDNLGEGIQITGPGNVMAFNRVSHFRDCLSFLELDEAVNQVSNDLYGNDLSECADDGIEADSSMGNVRVYQNRIANTFMGVSAQPSVGGPTYFIRNVMYNVVFESFKLHNGTVGDVILHNTVVKSGDAFAVFTEDGIFRTTARNNLLIGSPGSTHNGYDSGPGKVLDLASADTASCSLDYDGYGAIGVADFTGRIGGTTFANEAEMQSATTEKHGLSVGLDAFSTDFVMPTDPFTAPAAPDFALNPSGSAIDKGVVLPGLNDGFTGQAPDLGAYEAGLDEPQYGPHGHLGGDGNGSGGAPSSSTTTIATGAGSGTAAGPSGGAGAAGSGGAGSHDGGSEDGCGCELPARGQTGAGVFVVAAVLGLGVGRRWRRLVRRGDPGR